MNIHPAAPFALVLAVAVLAALVLPLPADHPARPVQACLDTGATVAHCLEGMQK